jgi:hypothetical protein
MTYRSQIDGKLAGETLNATFDFGNRLAVGETLSTTSVTAAVYAGVDASPGALISGASSISGTVVTQSLTGGVLGVTYLLKCAVTTSLAQTLQLTAFLVIVPDQY